MKKVCERKYEESKMKKSNQLRILTSDVIGKPLDLYTVKLLIFEPPLNPVRRTVFIPAVHDVSIASLFQSTPLSVGRMSKLPTTFPFTVTSIGFPFEYLFE